MTQIENSLRASSTSSSSDEKKRISPQLSVSAKYIYVLKMTTHAEDGASDT